MPIPPALTRDDTDAEPSKAPAGDVPSRADDDILVELRERRTYATNAWADRREEGRKDVLCVGGKVWEAMDPDGLKQRQQAVRPALAPDEIGQYLNQTGNDVRQNKRSIKATPIGGGATKDTANFIQGRIRQLEYRSNAQRDVYSPIFEDALQRSYGFGRFVPALVSPTSRKMELYIEAFPNPDVVLVDPDGAMLSPDCAKIQYAFILDASRTHKQFKREFPDSDATDFSDENRKVAPDWIHGERITLAEYWIVEQARRRVLFLRSDPARGVFEKDLPAPIPEGDARIDYEQWVDVPAVCQYLTNGIELLAKKGQPKRTPWRGKSIPIFSCFGKAIYTENGAGTTCEMLSMVRPMRQPVMYYSYIRTCQAEVIGAVPRATWVGYEGQFRGHEEEWTKANHEPVPYLVAKPFTEATGANNLLPLPQRQNWDPPLQNLDMAAESARRSIQAAAGTSPLPTEAQRVNQKSGKALDRIEASGQKGSYHFVDHLDGMITRVGQMAAELIPFYDDTIGEVTIRNFKDEPVQQSINDPQNPQSVMVSSDHIHDITISVGPYEADEREASSDFADTIVQNAPLMQMVGPQKAAELTAAAIRLKGVGPIGDEMAEIISPKPPEPGQPPTPQMLQQQQAQMQGLQQENQQLQQEKATEQVKQQATIDKAHIDAASREKIAQMNLDAKRMDNETKIAVAELGAKVDRLALFLEERARLGVQDQQASLAAHDAAHEAGMAAMAQQHGLDASAQAHQQQLEAGQQAHEQGLESGEQGADLAMQQAEHAQSIAPEPAEAGA